MDNHPPGLRLARYAMGTRFEAVLMGDDEVHLRAAGEAALDEIEFFDARLDLFKKDSFVCHLNRSAFDAPVRVDADFFDLLALCLRVSRASQGAFDITVGSLMECWGFHGGSLEEPRVEARARAMERVGFQQIELDEDARTIRFLKPGLRLDFGAVAKGFALDRAREILKDAGIRAALIHGGTSTIVAMGAPAGLPAWKIAIQDPEQDDAAIAYAELCDRTLSVSAPHGRSFRSQDRMWGHVMNTTEGGPAKEPLNLAAVVGTSAALADAWSTALVAAGAMQFDALMEAANKEMKPITALVGTTETEPVLSRLKGPEPELFIGPDGSSGTQES
ncbi:MAG: FAD:protein FMN transferase [Planctomycetota bacterium]